MEANELLEVSYFPGCSLATSARESNQSLVDACEKLGLRLVELDDWCCCGSSSAHAVDPELALNLAGRNLSSADPGRPLLVMCPSCFRNLSINHNKFKENAVLRKSQERKWGGCISPDLQIVSFIELMHFLGKLRQMGAVPNLRKEKKLEGMSIALYYGCMAMFPPSMKKPRVPVRVLETELGEYGADVKYWAYAHKCCGTFLTATRPDITTPIVNDIIEDAMNSGADCIVTACAMCQLNLEIRSNLPKKIPVFHFSELMALVLGVNDYEPWFKRHIIDPKPLLREKGLIV